MRVALIGAELEENLALRYMTSALESRGHEVSIIPFNFPQEIPQVVNQVIPFQAKIIGLSMVFTGRAREFCHLAEALRASGYRGHIVAGGHFASFNCERLLEDYPAFDSIGLGEGEELICALADNLENLFAVPGLCFRGEKAKIHINPVT
ncbi:MAG TPA: cobalamin B12-binding domain-containing protein, partial [bacterium]